jgi:hypothetical protein
MLLLSLLGSATASDADTRGRAPVPHFSGSSVPHGAARRVPRAAHPLGLPVACSPRGRLGVFGASTTAVNYAWRVDGSRFYSPLISFLMMLRPGAYAARPA